MGHVALFLPGGIGGGNQGNLAQHGAVCRLPVAEVGIDKPGMQMTGDKLRVLEQVAQKRNRGFDPQDHVITQRGAHFADGIRAILRPYHQLGQDRIVKHGHFHPAINAGIAANPRSLRDFDEVQFAERGKKAVFRIFRIDAAFQGVSLLAQVLLANAQRLPFGYADLLFDQVHPGHQLGNRMLHLDAGVDFQEVVILFLVEQKFHRAGIGIVDRLHHPAGGGAHLVPQCRIQRRRGSFLDNLLVPPLDGAFPFEEMNDVAVLVGQHLKFHMAGIFQVFFHVDRVVAEGRERFPLPGFDRRLQIGYLPHDAHAFAASAGAGLDHHRVADRLRQFGNLILVMGMQGDARRHRHPRFPHGLAGGQFIPYHRHRFRCGADENDPRFAAAAGEAGILGQESVPGMDRVTLPFLCRSNDLLNIKITLCRSCSTNCRRFVRLQHMEGFLIDLGIDRHGGDAQLPAGAYHPHRNFAAIGNQHFFDGRHGAPGLG